MPIHLTINNKRFDIIRSGYFDNKPSFFCSNQHQGRGHLLLDRGKYNNNFGFDNKEDMLAIHRAFNDDDKETIAYFTLKYS